MANVDLPAGYQRSPVTEDIIDEAAAHVQSVFMHESGRPFISTEDYRNFFQAPYLSLEDDVVFVRDNAGTLVAQAVIINRPPYVDPTCFAAVSPEHYEMGLGSALIEWEQARAEERIPETPQGARVLLQAFMEAGHERSVDHLENNGFGTDRYFLTMAIDFGAPPPAAVFPDDLELRPFTADQTEAAVAAMDDAFRDHYGRVERPLGELVEQIRHVMGHTDFDPTLWWHIYQGNEIVANCWNSNNHEGDKSVGYVQSLGVRKPWRGRGIGKHLLLQSFGEFHRRGMKGAALDVDAESLTGATRLYEAVGMKEVHRNAIYAKELRAGEDLAVRKL